MDQLNQFCGMVLQIVPGAIYFIHGLPVLDGSLILLFCSGRFAEPMPERLSQGDYCGKGYYGGTLYAGRA